jgi:Holliday junction DNA helicase RuvA
MIGYLDGKIILKKEKYIILETNNVGYKVFLSHQDIQNLPEVGQNIKLFIYHNIKEDASDLYGFFTHEQMDFFETLMEIRGVGPKAALEISVVGPLDRIKDKILRQDENVFAGIPGIGSKKAMTIILELTGKIKMLGEKKSSTDEAENALVQLGFTKQQAKGALAKVPANVKNPEDRIKAALKQLGR